MQMTRHKTASVFARYNIISDGDLRRGRAEDERSAPLGKIYRPVNQRPAASDAGYHVPGCRTTHR
jgi:hypothetical protein